MSAAIEAAAAKSRGVAGLSYVVGDVTRLPSTRLGTFDFFLDIGCFQGLDTHPQSYSIAVAVGAMAITDGDSIPQVLRRTAASGPLLMSRQERPVEDRSSYGTMG